MVDDEQKHQQHLIAMCQKDGGGRSFVVDPGDEEPSYCVSYGWSINFGLPEMIAFGSYLMALRSLAPMFDTVIDRIEEGTPLEDGQSWSIGDGRTVIGRFVHPSHLGDDYFRDARFVREIGGFTDPLAAYQLVWPDEEGRFPWDPGCSASCRRLQPLLFEPQPLSG